MADPLWPLLDAVAARGAAAWPMLVAALEPELAALAKFAPIGRLRDREDSPREIATRVLGRLHADDHAAIRRLCALEPRPELRAWLRVVVRRAAIDFMRGSPEFRREAKGDEARWISLATLSSRQHADVDTLAEKRRAVLAFVHDAVDQARRAAGDDAIGQLALAWQIERTHVRRLVARSEQYLRVLAAVLAGHSYAEAAAELDMTRREVELTVRYIEELLHARGFGR